MPRVIWRQRRIFIALLAVAGLVLILGQYTPGRWPGRVTVIAQLLGFGSAALFFLVRRRLRRRIRSADYEVCAHCAYPLCGLPEEHNCPECGTPFRKQELREIWREWLGQ
ncbi:MAG TPA: hypothetical protein VNA25_26505 [Phycisphaerae bacterium]|nr:hypothetical protein [Phycisphaerae bacterium]